MNEIEKKGVCEKGGERKKRDGEFKREYFIFIDETYCIYFIFSYFCLYCFLSHINDKQ